MPDTVARRCHRDNEADLKKLSKGKKIRRPDSKPRIFSSHKSLTTQDSSKGCKFKSRKDSQDFPEI